MANEALELLWEMGNLLPADEERCEALISVATVLEADGNTLGAAYAWERAAANAWGSPHLMVQCGECALAAYTRCIELPSECSYEPLLALQRLAELTYTWLTPESMVHRGHLRNLADRLVKCFGEAAERCAYLVRGVVIGLDFAGHVQLGFPEGEVGPSILSSDSYRRGQLQILIPPAFSLLVHLGDYAAAWELAELCPDDFSSPNLRGWRAAVNGFVHPASAPECFAEAARAFAPDHRPEPYELVQSRGRWSNADAEVWAAYFSARADFALAVRYPERVRELVARASSVLPEEWVWGEPILRRFGGLVRALALLLSDPSPAEPTKAKEYFSRWTAFTREEGDRLLDSFFSLASEAFEGFINDPAKEVAIGRLPRALDVLSRIPLLEPGLAAAVGPAMGQKALNLVYGPPRTWIYRTLEAVRDEKQLQRIVLRLCQASLPLYAQIVHGPIEYGKDLTVLLEEKGRRTLRSYQIKTGDIGLRSWRRDVKGQLEDIYLVGPSTLQIPGDPPSHHEAILLCNGHASPYAEPSMRGWFEEQREHARDFRFMHLDDLVNWIERDNLVAELRSALREVGVTPLT